MCHCVSPGQPEADSLAGVSPVDHAFCLIDFGWSWYSLSPAHLRRHQGETLSSHRVSALPQDSSHDKRPTCRLNVSICTDRTAA